MLYGCVTWSPRACHAEPTPGSWLAASVGESTIAPTTRFPIWIRVSRREVRASRRLYAGGGSCLRDETAEVRNVRRSGGRRGLCGGSGKRVDGVFPGRSQSFRHQRRPVDDCSPGQGGMAQNGRPRGLTFHGEMDRCRENQGWTTACSGMPERDGKNQEEDSPKQAGSCWFARPCWLATSGANLHLTGLQMPWRFFSYATFFLFCSVFSSLRFQKSRGPYFNSPSICRRSDSHTCFFLLLFSLFFCFIWRCRFFRVFFPLSLCMESTSYVLSFRMVFFLPCDHGLDFWHQLMW